MKITVDENLTIEGRDDSGYVTLTITNQTENGMEEVETSVDPLVLAKILQAYLD